ncbi:hypothetical protein GCM10027258_24300 [Amycolatopsis stemonae]
MSTSLYCGAVVGACWTQRSLEYLAAAYLVEQGIKIGQVPMLLGVHANGLSPTETLGWSRPRTLHQLGNVRVRSGTRSDLHF